MPSANADENGRNVASPAVRLTAAYSRPIRNNLRSTPGCFKGLAHIEGSMTRSASTCLQAARLIRVTDGISAMNRIGPTICAAKAKITRRLLTSAQVYMAKGCLRNRRKPSRTHCQPEDAGRNAACMALLGVISQ